MRVDFGTSKWWAALPIDGNSFFYKATIVFRICSSD
jgi:hypothetical protein